MELTLFLDHQCNLRCSYCYTGRKFNRKMPQEVLEKALRLALLSQESHLDIAFFGGEPLLHFDRMRQADQIVTHAISRRASLPTIRWLLNTNATLLTDEVLDWLMPPREANVFVSLDGPRDIHDSYRLDAAGKGTYDRVLGGLAKLKARGLSFRVLAVVGTARAADVGRILAELLALGAQQVHLSANFRDDWDEPSVQQLREGLRSAADHWMTEFRAGRICPVEPLHTKILTHLKGGLPCPSRCLLGEREFTVVPSGNIYPCAQMVEEDQHEALVIGHVDRGLDRARIAQLSELKNRVEATCAPCALRDRCQSHCGCRHLALSGRLGKITAVLCEIEAAMIEAADRVATTLYDENCPAFMDLYYRQPWVMASGGQLTTLRRSRDE
jgi:uncharacterized protein